MKIVELTYRYDGTEATARPRPADADAARARLDDGSRSIAALLESLTDGTGVAQRVIHVDPRDLGVEGGDRRAPPQRPFAAVLGCSDARVPIELVFNEGPNDLFVVRVAGNGLGAEVLGSLKYAVDHLGGSLKLIVVLGHSGCGAVTAAVDVYLKPGEYLALADKHGLRSILDRLLVVINAAAKRMAEVHGPGRDAPPRLSDRAHRGGERVARGARRVHAAAGTRRRRRRGICAPRTASISSTAARSGRRAPAARNARGSRIRRPISRSSPGSPMRRARRSGSSRCSIAARSRSLARHGGRAAPAARLRHVTYGISVSAAISR